MPTIEELRAKLNKILEGLAPKNANKNKKNTKLAGGYDLATTRGILNVNPGVSCYCISTMQLLYSIPEIRDAILAYDCEGLTLDETTIQAITDKSIQDSINSKYKEKAKVGEVIDGRMVFCAMKKLFEQLNSSTTTFDKLNETNAQTILNTTGKKNPIQNIYPKYIMRIFIAYMNKEIQEKNKKLLAKNPKAETEPLEAITRQQPVTDFFTGFIFPLLESDETLSHLTNIFNYRADTIYTCEQNTPTDPRKMPPRTGDIERIINLGISDFIDDKTTNVKNKYERGTELYSLDKIIAASQTVEVMKNDNELLGCGPKNTTPGAKNNGRTKGPGTMKRTYVIPDENRYLLLYTNRPRFDFDAQEKIFNTNEKLFVNPEITIDNKVYHIFGSILYSTSSGEERPRGSGIYYQKIREGGGHYIYDRFYLPDDEHPAAGTEANDLPFITYNDEFSSYQNTDINIDSRSYIIVYRLTTKPKVQPGPEGEGENAESNVSSVTSEEEQGENAESNVSSVTSEEQQGENAESNVSSVTSEEESENSQSSASASTENQPSSNNGSQASIPPPPPPPPSLPGSNNQSRKANSNGSQAATVPENEIDPEIQKAINERKAKNRLNAEASIKNNEISRKQKELNNFKKATATKRGWKAKSNNNNTWKTYSEFGNKMNYTQANRTKNRITKKKLENELSALQGKLKPTTGGKKKTFKKAHLKKKRATMKKRK
jgi:hypothetical protein